MTTIDGSQLHEGMRVLGMDHHPVGKIKLVRQGDFLVDRPLQPDVYVPFRLVESIEGDEVILNTEAELLDKGDTDRFPMPGMP